MAAPTASEPLPARSTVPLHRRVTFALFAGLVALAAVFYLWWGLAYNGWLDNGVYAITVVLAGFGLAGMWLVLPSPAVPPAPRD